MLDLGWQEFFLIALVAVLIVGPKDLPNVIRTVMKAVRKLRAVARDFQNSVEEVAREAELDEVRKQAQSLASGDIGHTIRNAVDPDGSMMDAINETRSAVEDTRAQAIADPSAGFAAPAPSPESPAGAAAPAGPGRRETERPKPGRPAAAKRTPRSRGVGGPMAVRRNGGPRRLTVKPTAAGGSVWRKPSVGPER